MDVPGDQTGDRAGDPPPNDPPVEAESDLDELAAAVAEDDGYGSSPPAEGPLAYATASPAAVRDAKLQVTAKRLGVAAAVCAAVTFAAAAFVASGVYLSIGFIVVGPGRALIFGFTCHVATHVLARMAFRRSASAASLAKWAVWASLGWAPFVMVVALIGGNPFVPVLVLILFLLMIAWAVGGIIAAVYDTAPRARGAD